MSASEPTASEEAIKKHLRRIGILILDSSPQVTELFRNMFSEFGFTNVFTANNGFKGVQILREVQVSLIITDWELKLQPADAAQAEIASSQQEALQMSGIHFVERLRRAPNSPNPYIPIVMFVNMVDRLTVERARDAGVNEIVIKPLSAEELCRRVIEVIIHPRIFVTDASYRGPCRRRNKNQSPPHGQERRRKEIRIIRYKEK